MCVVYVLVRYIASRCTCAFPWGGFLFKPTGRGRSAVRYTLLCYLSDNVDLLFGCLYFQMVHHQVHNDHGVLFGDFGQLVA